MSRGGRRLLAVAGAWLGVAACLAPLRLPSPPSDAGERRRAELDACRRGALPAWLGDAALSTAAQLDRGEAQAGALNESFLADSASAMARPPPATASAAGSRIAAILTERRGFEEECQALRTAGRQLVPSPGAR